MNVYWLTMDEISVNRELNSWLSILYCISVNQVQLSHPLRAKSLAVQTQHLTLLWNQVDESLREPNGFNNTTQPNYTGSIFSFFKNNIYMEGP